jgi:hypothetical protein
VDEAMVSRQFALFLESSIIFMKTLFLAGIFIMSLNLIKAQTTEAVLKPLQTQAAEVIEFKLLEHDFGKIPQNKPVYFTFEWVNKSKTAVKLDNVSASCGCTTPEWSAELIAPGATGKIKVGYNAASEGYFLKPITVTYNGNQTKQINIKGTVWKAPIGSAPANSSVQFLKTQIQ